MTDEIHMCSLSGKLCVLAAEESRVTLFTGKLWIFYVSLIAFADLLWLFLFEEAFIKVMKLSVRILEADSVHLCHVQLCFSIGDRIRSIPDILCHGDRMYLHALTNKMVSDTNSLSINELPEVETSQNNFEHCLNDSKFDQGRIDRSFCGEGPFRLLKQVLINVFSDSPNAMLVLDCYVMAVMKKCNFFVPI